MRYLMKQKLFAFGDDFYIKDENGNDIFFVDGKAFSLGDRFSLQDRAGNELAYIKQKLLALTPSYEIHRGGELYAVVKKDFFNFFICGYTVDVPGPDDLRAEGSLFEHEYAFKRGEQVVHGDKLLEEKLGRNDLCPCGSGNRFRKCCLSKGCF